MNVRVHRRSPGRLAVLLERAGFAVTGWMEFGLGTAAPGAVVTGC